MLNKISNKLNQLKLQSPDLSPQSGTSPTESHLFSKHASKEDMDKSADFIGAANKNFLLKTFKDIDRNRDKEVRQ